MNKLLRLSGTPLVQTPKKMKKVVMGSLTAKAVVTSEHLRQLSSQLKNILSEWYQYPFFSGKLIDVVYTRVVPKSNRLSYLFGSKASEENIRGVRYKSLYVPKENTQHIITYYLDEKIVHQAIDKLDKAAQVLEQKFNGEISGSRLNELISLKSDLISLTGFKNVVKDSFFVEEFVFPQPDAMDMSVPQVLSFYQTEENLSAILNQSGFDIRRLEKLDDLTYIAKPEDLRILLEKVPFLISMSCTDFSKIEFGEIEEEDSGSIFRLDIPDPTNEPVVGVLDTLFDEKVYFSKWVDFTNLVDPDVIGSFPSPEDYSHGTKVSYLIVDGPSLNSQLNDGCGRFRVKHFAVAKGGKVSGVSVLRNILKAVQNNPDIKVWNLSLGANTEISRNTISFIAAEIDRLQAERPDLVFVIAATNKPKDVEGEYFIGSPADSINSLVVNACTREGNRTDYSRHGPVLSFFTKPDICTFGGVVKDGINAALRFGPTQMFGTSFAAPWITRKMAYLMYKIGLTREEAKALIIDSSLSWTESADPDIYHGFGKVPVKIDDVLAVKDNEIRFFITGTMVQKQVETYQIPVPIVKDKFPFIARAVLSYFPKCDRKMGVDYTETELDLHFGRVFRKVVKGVPGELTIKTINNNHQGDPVTLNLTEGKVRDKWRKWDNVKVISEGFTEGKRPKAAGERSFGLKIVRTERRGSGGAPIPFSALITLRNISNENVISTFIKNCQVVGWLVQQIDVDTTIRFYEEAEEEVSFGN